MLASAIGRKAHKPVSKGIYPENAAEGHHIQFNVIDRQTFIDTQDNPEEYRGLIVHVVGYSDYFRNLSKELQDEIINRTEQSFE